MTFHFSPIGFVHSTLKERSDAPRQGWEGAPNARLEVLPAFVQGLDGIKAGEEIWIFTWLHEARRSVFKVRPRDDLRNPMKGVLFSPNSKNLTGSFLFQVGTITDPTGSRTGRHRNRAIIATNLLQC
jgi:tRNA (Thr-GGU) A37 N-methylase